MNKVYVGNLSSELTDTQLNDLALPYGELHSANIARALAGGVSKGFGFIEYATAAEALAAIKGLNGKKVNGHALEVRSAGATPLTRPA